MQGPTHRIIERGREFLRQEGEAILHKARTLDAPFDRLVARLLALPGRVAVTGVGKSGVIGEKISATLSSTGTPSFFLRPVEALHGDLGMLQPDDILVALSNSGETSELLAVYRAAAELGLEIIAFTGVEASTLGQLATMTIDTGVDEEACPLGLAPTTSTTVTLAIGDALALVLLEERGFTSEHYARFHPGGNLGERLRYRVQDVMRQGEDLPIVGVDASLADAIDEMTARDNLGLTLVVEANERLVGIVTDGDLRRILRGNSPGNHEVLDSRVREVMTTRPLTIAPSASAKDALQLMEVRGITSLAVISESGAAIGVVHLHDILGRGQIVL